MSRPSACFQALDKLSCSTNPHTLQEGTEGPGIVMGACARPQIAFQCSNDNVDVHSIWNGFQRSEKILMGDNRLMGHTAGQGSCIRFPSASPSGNFPHAEGPPKYCGGLLTIIIVQLCMCCQPVACLKSCSCMNICAQKGWFCHDRTSKSQ